MKSCRKCESILTEEEIDEFGTICYTCDSAFKEASRITQKCMQYKMLDIFDVEEDFLQIVKNCEILLSNVYTGYKSRYSLLERDKVKEFFASIERDDEYDPFHPELIKLSPKLFKHYREQK
jgi:hypothetical protein